MPFCIDDEELLEKYKIIWTKIGDLKNIELNALPVYDDRYLKTKIRTSVDKGHANFRGLNVLEDDVECASFTAISIDSLLVYKNKYYLQVYLDNCACKIVDKQMINDLGDNQFVTDENYFLINRSYKCDKIDIRWGIYVVKSNSSQEYIICHYWFILIMGSNLKILYTMVPMI